MDALQPASRLWSPLPPLHDGDHSWIKFDFFFRKTDKGGNGYRTLFFTSNSEVAVLQDRRSRGPKVMETTADLMTLDGAPLGSGPEDTLQAMRKFAIKVVDGSIAMLRHPLWLTYDAFLQSTNAGCRSSRD